MADHEVDPSAPEDEGEEPSSESVIDEYGFEVEGEGVPLYQKQEKKRIEKEADRNKQWEVLFLKYKRRDDELFNSSKFKKLVAKGIPVQYRGFVWYTFSGAAARATRANAGEEPPPDLRPQSQSVNYGSLKRPTKSRTLKVSYYQDLQRQLRNLTTGSRRISAALEIEKDLRRTFPGHPLFEAEDGKAILRRILLAYALRNPNIGYCQSMNVLAAFILLVTQPNRQHQYHANPAEAISSTNPTNPTNPANSANPTIPTNSATTNSPSSSPPTSILISSAPPEQATFPPLPPSFQPAQLPRQQSLSGFQPAQPPRSQQPTLQLTRHRSQSTQLTQPSQTTTTQPTQPTQSTQQFTQSTQSPQYFQPAQSTQFAQSTQSGQPPQSFLSTQSSHRSSHQRTQSSLPVNLAEQWEERAFWILVEMIEGRCVDYYTRTLRGSQVDLRVLAQVLALHLPTLTTHFETLGLSLPLLATRWFMCVFALVLPVHTALHIWDQVLVHSQLGTNTPHVARDYVVLFAVSLLQCAQDSILQKGGGSVSDIVLLLDKLPRFLHDKKELLQHYKSISFRLPPGGELMTNMRQSATEHVDAETKDIKRARDLMQAARQTKFSSVELSEIHSMLFKSSATHRSDRGSISMGVEGFQNILSHMIPGIAQSPAIHRLFKALDQNNDNKLDFREMICGLSILAKGTLDEKLELLFRSFDVDGTGFITQTQLEALITSVSSQLDPEYPDKHASMGSGVVGTDPLGVRVVSVSTFVEQVFAHLCITTGRLSLEQFRQAVIAEPRLTECLMIGLDQEEIELNMTPLIVPPEEEVLPPSRKPSVSSQKSSVNPIMATQPFTHTSTHLPTQTYVHDTDDSELPLGVTNAGNQTPLLGDERGNPRKSTTLPRVLDESICCILL
eukprot:Phypoly_transcript_01818.p1 GENE.Phypoly_transcript_01818~~Phypoly_transcript_01818.p1  ORF type:complete len:898 (+),score=138.55 Phypoly_transcript_01818:81-2774(+)